MASADPETTFECKPHRSVLRSFLRPFLLRTAAWLWCFAWLMAAILWLGWGLGGAPYLSIAGAILLAIAVVSVCAGFFLCDGGARCWGRKHSLVVEFHRSHLLFRYGPDRDVIPWDNIAGVTEIRFEGYPANRRSLSFRLIDPSKVETDEAGRRSFEANHERTGYALGVDEFDVGGREAFDDLRTAFVRQGVAVQTVTREPYREPLLRMPSRRSLVLATFAMLLMGAAYAIYLA